MASHDYNFQGGDKLRRIGATWFVSYLYWKHCDKKHLNWKNIDTAEMRERGLNNSKNFHKFWLTQILKMNHKNLDRNGIGVNAVDTISHAGTLINKNLP